MAGGGGNALRLDALANNRCNCFRPSSHLARMTIPCSVRRDGSLRVMEDRVTQGPWCCSSFLCEGG